jgi:hypothetical protein
MATMVSKLESNRHKIGDNKQVMPHCRTTVQTDRQRQKKPAAHFSTLGFARHTSQRFAKPKELKFSHRTD